MPLDRVAASMEIIPLTEKHYPQVAKIYQQGLDTGVATFETSVPSWEQWNEKFLQVCRYVMVEADEVLAWCALSATSKRAV